MQRTSRLVAQHELPSANTSPRAHSGDDLEMRSASTGSLMQSDGTGYHRESSVDTHDGASNPTSFARAGLAGAHIGRNGSVNSASTLAGVMPTVMEDGAPPAPYANHAHAALLQQRLRVTTGDERMPALTASPAPSLRRDSPQVPVRPKQNRLHLAAWYGSTTETARLLHQSPFNVDDVDVFGRSALHLAAEGAQVAVARHLLGGVSGGRGEIDIMSAHGVLPPSVVAAEVNLRTAFGLTPAHYAAAHGHVSMLRLLHHAGADLGARCSFQATPLDLARAHGQGQAADFLRRGRNSSAGPVWRPDARFFESISAWQQTWHDLVNVRGRGGRDDFLSAVFGVAHDELVWPVTPEMQHDLKAFRRKWQQYAILTGAFDSHASPLIRRQGQIVCVWPQSSNLMMEMATLHQRWQQEALAAVLGVPAGWVQYLQAPGGEGARADRTRHANRS